MFCSSASSKQITNFALQECKQTARSKYTNLFCITRKHSTFPNNNNNKYLQTFQRRGAVSRLNFTSTLFTSALVFPSNKDFLSPGHKLARERVRPAKSSCRKAGRKKPKILPVGSRIVLNFPLCVFGQGGAMLIIILSELGCLCRTFVYGFIAGAMQSFNLSLAKQRAPPKPAGVMHAARTLGKLSVEQCLNFRFRAAHQRLNFLPAAVLRNHS